MKKIKFLQFCLLILSIFAFCASAQEFDKDEKEKRAWSISELDLKVELPESSETKDAHEIEITRRFNGAFEEALLKKAEAAYPSAEIQSVDAKEWAVASSDDIRHAKVVTASAVRYHYDLSKELRRDVRYIKNYPYEHTTLEYKAEIKLYPEFTEGDEKYNNVYVAKMSLYWTAICGGLCDGGFQTEKEVIFDLSGEIKALYMPKYYMIHNY